MSLRTLPLWGLVVAVSLLSRPAHASWDEHLITYMGAVRAASGIYGLDGKPWATNGKIKVTPAEIKALLDIYAVPGHMSAPRAKFNGIEYTATRADAHLLAFVRGADGVITIKTHKAVIVCIFREEDVSPEKAQKATENFANYVASQGY